jgi:putative transposase
MDIRTGRHVVFMIHAHLVFTTKKRGKVLSSQHLDRLKEIFAAICVDFEAELREFNGERITSILWSTIRQKCDCRNWSTV